MIRTVISIFISLALLLGVSFFEANYVKETFEDFHAVLRTTQHKVAGGNASYNDGLALREFWDNHKTHLHAWIPHGVLYEIDYQLDEAIGFLAVGDCEGALPKIEVVLGLSENIPEGYALTFGNVF